MGNRTSVARLAPGGLFLGALFSTAMVLPLLWTDTMMAEEQAADPEPQANERSFPRAEGAAPQGDRSERRAGMRKKMLEKFDADGDGKLNEEERTKMRVEMQKRKRGSGERGDRGGKRGRFGKGTAERGPEGRRQGPHGGLPDLDNLFEKFDHDGDDRLDRKEFKAALHAMREMHQRRMGHPGEGRRGGPGSGKDRDGFHRRPRPDREGRPGPPPERGPRE